jgi:hypothetical protein
VRLDVQPFVEIRAALLALVLARRRPSVIDCRLEGRRVARLGEELVGDRRDLACTVGIGVAGQHDPDDVWERLADDGEQGRTVHTRHPHVRDDDVKWERGEPL